MNKPNVSASIPSACNSALGWCSKITGSFAERSRNGAGSSANVASISPAATAHDLSQFKLMPPMWREGRALTTANWPFLAFERCVIMVDCAAITLAAFTPFRIAALTDEK
jgi:hypothetical protein